MMTRHLNGLVGAAFLAATLTIVLAPDRAMAAAGQCNDEIDLCGTNVRIGSTDYGTFLGKKDGTKKQTRFGERDNYWMYHPTEFHAGKTVTTVRITPRGNASGNNKIWVSSDGGTPRTATDINQGIDVKLRPYGKTLVLIYVRSRYDCGVNKRCNRFSPHWITIVKPPAPGTQPEIAQAPEPVKKTETASPPQQSVSSPPAESPPTNGQPPVAEAPPTDGQAPGTPPQSSITQSPQSTPQQAPQSPQTQPAISGDRGTTVVAQPESSPQTRPRTVSTQAPVSPTAKALGRLASAATAGLKAGTPGGDAGWQASPATASLAGLEAIAEDDRTRHYLSLAGRHGVSRAFARRTFRPSPYKEHSYLHYAGWMDHSFFFASGVAALEFSPGTESFETAVHSMGAATGSNPISGSATWKGAMAGFDVGDTATRGNLIEGDATVTIDDFDNPAVDVALTGLRDRSTRRARASITWDGVALTDGAFAGEGLSGWFYGPNHEEVGGVFLRDRISGAFGAKRQ